MNLKEKLAIKAKPINKALEEYLKVREPEKLYKASAHIPLAGGKRLRPVMAMITCEMVGGDSVKAIPFAAALEAIHNFTLVHDDVMDDDDLRHGVDACHTIYGLSTAILAGDTLFAYAFEMITDCDIDDRVKADLVKNVAYIVRKIAEGQQMDINFEDEETVDAKEYLEMIRLKTSILFGAAAYGGAKIGGTSEEEARELEMMATNVGLGFQIWDDYLDATATEEILGKPSGSDIRQGKRTLLVIEALNRANANDRERLIEILDSKNTDEEVAEAVEIMDRCGALEECHKQANGYLEGARNTLSNYPESEARQLFEELLEYMVTRGH
ncbi:MAG: polyprenyl synthetase family protein [Candidatus Poseidoniia archaeon]|jgi:geranylgeranyl diphosphate synthase type I|nr:polyprenyl synthetase family protein [Candidatus Poseidoniia archaeon]|tara:strand:- start:473 stop:1453 length:981 start_codon:yes stop_codon:yes gene_type:complete